MFAARFTSKFLAGAKPVNFARCMSEASHKYALYGWGPSITGIGSGMKSKEKMIPHPIIGFDKKVRDLSVGYDHCAAITEDGKLFTWGKNGCYECGLGHGDDVLEPTEVTALSDFPLKQVVCGQNHTAALSEEGYVFTWGLGHKYWNAGALGHGDKDNQPSPVVVDYLYDNGIKIKKIVSGCYFMHALSEEGDLYTWGRGEYGALATTSVKDLYTPTKSEFPDMFGKIKDVTCGQTFTMILTEDNKIFTFGRDDDSQLGREQGLSLDSNAIDSTPLPVEVPAGETVKQMAGGYGSAAIVCESGNIYWWGMKLHIAPYQEVILRRKEGEENAHVVKMTEAHCGGHMIDALSEDGILYTWGDARKQPYGLPNRYVITGTEISSLSSLGKVYNFACGQSMVLAAVEMDE